MSNRLQDRSDISRTPDIATTTVRIPKAHEFGPVDYADVEFREGDQLIGLTRLVLLADPADTRTRSKAPCSDRDGLQTKGSRLELAGAL